MANVINVTACDNELIIMAYQWGASYELCRILSGNNNTVNVLLNIQAGPYQGSLTCTGVTTPINVPNPMTVTVPAGEYQLMLLGINWGGPTQFTVNVNGKQYALPPQGNGNGLVFNPGPIPLTV
jgi:hypothetical protein